MKHLGLGSRVLLQAVNPAISAKMTRASKNKSAMGVDPGCPLAFSISPSFKKLSLAFVGLKPLFPTASSAKSRSRTLDGNKEDTIAVVLAAVCHNA